MKQDPAERAAKLRDLINDYRYNYHVLDKSIMSEAAADSLKHELSQIEAEHPDLITPDFLDNLQITLQITPKSLFLAKMRFSVLMDPMFLKTCIRAVSSF